MRWFFIKVAVADPKPHFGEGTPGIFELDHFSAGFKGFHLKKSVYFSCSCCSQKFPKISISRVMIFFLCCHVQKFKEKCHLPLRRISLFPPGSPTVGLVTCYKRRTTLCSCIHNEFIYWLNSMVCQRLVLIVIKQ